jgi:hypothetical protein
VSRGSLNNFDARKWLQVPASASVRAIKLLKISQSRTGAAQEFRAPAIPVH